MTGFPKYNSLYYISDTRYGHKNSNNFSDPIHEINGEKHTRINILETKSVE